MMNWPEWKLATVAVVGTLLALPLIWLAFNLQIDGVPIILLPVIAFFVLGVPIWTIGAFHGRDGYMDDGRDSWTTRY